MRKYFISATDYGPGNNDKYPRWRVYAFDTKREPWGHIGNHPVSRYFWTDAEAREELKRLEEADDSLFAPLAVVFAAGIILYFIILYFMGLWR